MPYYEIKLWILITSVPNKSPNFPQIPRFNYYCEKFNIYIQTHICYYTVYYRLVFPILQLLLHILCTFWQMMAHEIWLEMPLWFWFAFLKEHPSHEFKDLGFLQITLQIRRPAYAGTLSTVCTFIVTRITDLTRLKFFVNSHYESTNLFVILWKTYACFSFNLTLVQ